MASAAGLAFAVGGESAVATGTSTSALVELVRMGETAISKVFDQAQALSNKSTAFNWLPSIYAFLLIVPYALLMISYVSQLTVGIFRLIMLSIFAPFLVMAFGFKWGRQMTTSGLRTTLSTIVVIFAATSALALAIYGVSTVEFDKIEEVTITDPQILTAMALGWMGTALMTEGVGIANSVTGSALSNTAAGIMTAGIAGSALAGAGAAWRHKQGIAGKAMGAAGLAGGGLATGVSAMVNPSGAGSAMMSGAQDKLSRFKEFYNTSKGNFNKFG